MDLDEFKASLVSTVSSRSRVRSKTLSQKTQNKNVLSLPPAVLRIAVQGQGYKQLADSKLLH